MNRSGATGVLLTGATGFVGGAIAARLVDDAEFRLVCGLREGRRNLGPEYRPVTVGDLAGDTNWSEALSGADIVIHASARVHQVKDLADDPSAEFRRVNVDGTLNLARQAAAANVRRFLFISSIKVNGEQTSPGRAFRADDPPAPEDAYGISKWEAEIGLFDISRQTGMEVVVIRPPLVYGVGVAANFFDMMRWINSGLPLPLGSIRNERSLVALDNLVDLIITCMKHPAAANQVFLVADGQDLSTTELLQRTARALGKKTNLLPCPVALLDLAARLLGKRDLVRKLTGSLRVDIGKTRSMLDWEPPVSVDQGLQKAAADFQCRKASERAED